MFMDAWRQERGEVNISVSDDSFIVIRWVEGRAWLRDPGVSLQNKRSNCLLEAGRFTLAQVEC